MNQEVRAVLPGLEASAAALGAADLSRIQSLTHKTIWRE